MADKSEIEWTDATWNPVRGCTKVSPGCKHCYAETFAERFRGVPRHPYEQGFDLRLVPDKLADPLLWKQPRRVFVNSMSDLFHEDVPDDYIAAVFGVMASAPRHTFQVLTKRAKRMREWFEWIATRARHHGNGMSPATLVEIEAANRCDVDILGLSQWPLRNVWMGVSVESPEYLARLDELRATPAAVRFASFEPLLADLGDISRWVFNRERAVRAAMYGATALNREQADAVMEYSLDWVIVGAERHHRARPMHDAWVRSLRDQCDAAGTSFFYKQQRVNRRMVSLPVLDGRQWAEFPEVRA